jgi:hypothetical protein
MEGMENLIEVLMQRLVDRGLEPKAVPAFVRNLSYVIAANPNIGIGEMNRQMESLGWEGIELDNVTYQLGIAVFEPDFDETRFLQRSPDSVAPMATELAG